ncbi:hypothetical protein CIK81_05045 [Brachybacterium sp. JB7]|uniref:hypothetical protein n=1 Tax=Brachybacterium TaxID=43668 RepID=UPI000BB7E715|nr:MULTISPECIES: hypothetical protein [Brachybacterium]PCC34014.1 hypothetical protein CIK71_07070 [Brachybacterium alimentarium]RCS63875.1 hypothetical protein CIK73_15855 [Brachybacterium alimentarium]RCS65562.1 hypothetical protein CIK81_05045 [Brachybacterium sp. JB7]RCS74519.1 hypothetical protein CIK68_07240 [Brachybacterium alimentarium]RCS85561.1 hypothetical protein CIK69_16425 [Brachybacterium alimentarium]
MSFNVIVIPEDDRLDSYILTPVLKAALAWVGKPRATVRMVSKPHPRGIDTVLTTAFFDQVRRRYGMADLFLYCIDRDGSPANDARLLTAVQNAAQRLRATQNVDGRTAHQEVEVWGLAACGRTVLTDSFATIRAHRDPKEAFFDPAAESLGVHRGPGHGREHIGRLAGSMYSRVRQRCPELQEIEEIFREAAD